MIATHLSSFFLDRRDVLNMYALLWVDKTLHQYCLCYFQYDMHRVEPTPLPLPRTNNIGPAKKALIASRVKISGSRSPENTISYSAAILCAGGSGGGGGAKCTWYEKGVNDGQVVQCFVHPPSWISLARGHLLLC